MKKYFRFVSIYLLYMLCFFVMLSIAKTIILSYVCNTVDIKGKAFTVIYVLLDCILLILSYFLSTLAGIKHGIRKRKQLNEKKFMFFIALFFVAISLLNILINFLTYSYDLDVIFNNTDVYIKRLSGEVETIKDIKLFYKILSIIKCIITSIYVLPMILVVRKKVFLKQNTQ